MSDIKGAACEMRASGISTRKIAKALGVSQGSICRWTTPGYLGRIAERAAAARDHVAGIRSQTKCEQCGEQPIEWHREEHVATPHRRIAYLAAHGYPISEIDEEIALCDALCRRCHMSEDGRIFTLRKQHQVNARITEDEVRAIRRDTRSQSAIAADYGISRPNVSLIKSGKTWGHVA